MRYNRQTDDRGEKELLPRFEGHHLEPQERKVVTDVERVGWSIMLVDVEPEKNQPGWAFTIGRFESYGHPEVAIFGLDEESRHNILNWIGENGKERKPLVDRAPSVRVWHELDGDWQFIGPVEDPGQDGVKLSCFHGTVERDPTLRTLRNSRKAGWRGARMLRTIAIRLIPESDT